MYYYRGRALDEDRQLEDRFGPGNAFAEKWLALQKNGESGRALEKDRQLEDRGFFWAQYQSWKKHQEEKRRRNGASAGPNGWVKG